MDIASLLGYDTSRLPTTRKIGFRDNDKIVIRGVDYRSRGRSAFGVALKRIDEDSTELFSFEHIRQMLDDPERPMVVHRNFYRDEAGGKPKNRPGLMSLPVARQDSIIWKEMWARAAIQWQENIRRRRQAAAAAQKPKPQLFSATSPYSLERELPGIRTSLETRMNSLFADGATYKTANSLKLPKPRTLAGWVSVYLASKQDPLSFYDNYQNSRVEYFSPDVLVMLKAALKKGLTETDPNLRALHTGLEIAVNAFNAKNETKHKVPSYECLRERWHKIPEYVRVAAQSGKEAAMDEFSTVNRGRDVLRPLEIVEMDEYKTDLQSLLVDVGIWEQMSPKERAKVKRTRLWITAAICVATRCIVGLRVHIKPPRLASALSTLEMTTLDKTSIAKAAGCVTPWDMYGSLEQLSVDSAAWLASRPLRLVVNDLGADFFLPAAGDPSMRGTIERWFKTFGHLMFNYFDGRTWSSVDERGEYNSQRKASATADMVAKCIYRFVVDGYHNREHDGLWMSTPRQRWIELETEYGVLPEPVGDRRREMFGIPFEARLGRHGVRKLGLDYNSRQIRDLFKENSKAKVLCQLDRHDIFSLSVWVGEGWVKVPCQYPELRGVSLLKFVATCTKLKLFNRENAATSRQVFLDTMAYLEEQPELARLGAEMISPFLDDIDIAKIDRALERGFKFDDQVPVSTVAHDGEWRPSDEFYDIMGISRIVYAKPPEAGEKAPLTRPAPESKQRQKPAAKPRSKQPPSEPPPEPVTTAVKNAHESKNAISTMFDGE
ncbi:hypothetical protein [Rhizobium ruizarguesonis]|uniref:Integrase catalytic domain-containing protein n=1 Tax=Rhizobium ruizarguesonis TaxID=2081791 RepID=A0ABY1X842_9HYPH|nr:hypothetical protein [Rhizobium ruizarguesonis]TAX81143.1 hypothetical protein ELH98_08725 [Rhizobium ruizarguesonis]TBE22879.1 hypothetical protein ELH08_08220 [Rhizobium ruizarguesonis]